MKVATIQLKVIDKLIYKTTIQINCISEINPIIKDLNKKIKIIKNQDIIKSFNKINHNIEINELKPWVSDKIDSVHLNRHVSPYSLNLDIWITRDKKTISLSEELISHFL